MKIRIVHLYPDLLDLYGDRGNVMVLAARSRWRGFQTEIHKVSLGESFDISETDILFIGGGSDREQELLIEDLSARTAELKDAITDGLVMLTICGGYQMLGQYYQTSEGQKIPGLGILDLYTIGGKKRLIGNVIAELDSGLLSGNHRFGLNTLVGFENHSGKTYLGKGLTPLAKIIKGYGNNAEDGCEGVRYKNVFGTYLHGPVLPKNPHFADLLLESALARKGCSQDRFGPLDDSLERNAHQVVIMRFGKNYN